MASDPKKDLDKLRHFLKHKEVPVDVEETFTHFQESTGESSYDRYLSYLRDNKHIDENTFAGAHGLTGVEVTGETGSSSYMESIRYDLYDVIAEGAMGEIVLGRDRDLRRKVAIKVLKREHKSTPVMKRFITEAQVTAQLDHPNIIPVYSLEIDPDGNVSFAMKLIQGHTLKDVIHQMLDCLEFEGLQQFNRRFPLADRLDILLRVCDAMSYAHNRGVIHRDLKPANIMLGAFGEVYVMDWGIARLMEKKEQGETLWQESGGEGLEAAHVERTRVGHVVGTPRYMSPEQAQGRGDLLDERSDLYVLGLILFELVTLNKALEGERVDDVLKSASKGQLQPIVFRARGSRIPPPLKAVIQKATACEPADRYAHVADLAEDIRRFVRGQEVSAFPENLLQRSIRFMARHRMTTLLSVVSIIAMLALSASWSLYRQKSALQESRVRESRFVRFQSETDIRAHEIDTHFLRFENILTLLADTVAWQITYGRESDAPILEYGQLKTDKGLTQDSAAYQLPISVEALSYKLPEDMPDDEGYAMLPRLAPLTAGFRKALIDSRFERRPLNEKVANARILEDGMPVKWAYAALSDGLFLCYPGSVEYPERYNARERPWYATGYGQYEPVWSEPYEDVDGQGRVLTCSVSLFDREGAPMGVVALDLDFNRALRGLLPSQEELGEKTACLLDASGNVIFSVGRDPHALDIREGQPFPVPTLVEAVLRKDAGLLLSPKAGETLALAFQRIPAMDWYYVEKAELDELLTQ